MIQSFTFKQHGGTTMGVVLGIVLGLAVALGVSLYLAYSGAPIQTKGVNNAARIEPPKDVANAPDPNAALYTKVPKSDESKSGDKDTGKEPAKPASALPAATNNPAPVKPEQDGIGKIAAIVTPAPAASGPASPVPAAPTALPTPASSASVSTPSASNVGNSNSGTLPSLKIIEPRTIENIAMPKTVNAAAGGERYFVQAGAFANAAEAEALKAKLAMQGVSMTLSPRDRDGQILQRVRTAPLAAADAEKLRNNLKANGIETSLVKVQ